MISLTRFIARLSACLLIPTVLFVACKNKTSDAGLPPDSTLVAPPVNKIQDTSSLTDTSYRIGDSL